MIKNRTGLTVSRDLKRSGNTLAVTDFRKVFEASPTARVRLARAGVDPSDIKRIVCLMDMPQDRLLKNLNLSAATLNRRAKQGKGLSVEDSERVMGLARLIGQAQAIVRESGDAKNFDAARWVARWLDTPLPALGGEAPGIYMDTMEGQGMVANLLARAQTGAYA
jgi:putative toxin-antitoxin system antitoxin component (TIGR02293 family)